MVAVFHCWPSFHDAEVLRVCLSRERTPAITSGPWLELDIYTIDTDGTVTSDGHYRLPNEVIASFRLP